MGDRQEWWKVGPDKSEGEALSLIIQGKVLKALWGVLGQQGLYKHSSSDVKNSLE